MKNYFDFNENIRIIQDNSEMIVAMKYRLLAHKIFPHLIDISHYSVSYPQ